MASRYWGVNQGQHDTDVLEQSSAPSTAVIVQLDLTKNMSREDLLTALAYIQMVVLRDKWPPA